MKHIKANATKILSLATMLMAFQGIAAQQVNSLYFLEQTPFHTKWNPAMAPNRTAIGLGVGSITMSVQSDLALKDFVYPSTDPSGIPSTFLSGSSNTFLEGLNPVSNIGSNVSVDLFDLGLRLGSKAYLTFTSSINEDFGIGLPKDFFKLIVLGTDNNGNDLDLSALNMKSLTYVKAGAGLALNLTKNLSIGASANYLIGLSDIRMSFDQFSIKSDGSEFNITTKGNMQMTSPDFLYLNNTSGTFPMPSLDNDKLSQFLSNPTLPKAGSGLSFDFGLKFKPMHFLTLSAAVTDLGKISWDPAYISRFKANNSFSFNGLDMTDQSKSMSEKMSDAFKDIVKFEADNGAQAYTSKLTTKVNVGLEAGLMNNHISLGLLSQTGITETGKYQDYMASLNFKPGSMLQTALTYSLLHGEMSALGAAVNLKLLFLNLYVAADYIPLKVTPDYMPINNSNFNVQTGFNLMF
jgi:hypothetical protein